MRIAIVSPYDWAVPGGVNEHTAYLVNHLEAQGHEVWVIAPLGKSGRATLPLPSHFVSVGRTFPVRANGSVAHVNVWPFMLQTMSRILGRIQPDVVHVHEPAVPAAAAAATLVARAPVVGTFHAAGKPYQYYGRFLPLARRVIQCLAVRIAVSPAARECVAAHFPGEYRIIPNGIDVHMFAAARDGQRIPGRVVFIGRPEPRKGLDVLLKAFLALHREMPHTSLALVGPTEGELRALATRLDCDRSVALAQVHALGRIPDEEKIQQMRHAEVLCAPSLDGESFGIVLVEAMASGVPVVASDLPGYRAVLREGKGGLLVPPGNSSALQDALRTLLYDEELRTSLREAGIAIAEQHSWENLVPQVIKVYEEAIALGPCRVSEVRVPLGAQIRHFLRTGQAPARKLRPPVEDPLE